jgi:hypothetical protein
MIIKDGQHIVEFILWWESKFYHHAVTVLLVLSY